MHTSKYTLIALCFLVPLGVVVHAETSAQSPSGETSKNPAAQIRKDMEAVRDSRKEAIKNEQNAVRSDVRDIRADAKSGSTTKQEAAVLQKQRLQDGRETIEKTREEARTELEKKRADITEEIKKTKEERIRKNIEIMLTRYNAAYERLLQIHNRIAEHITKVESNGQSVASAKTELEKAKVALTTIPTTLASFKTALEAMAATPEDESKKDAVKTQSEHVKNALKTAHEALIKTITALKPGKPVRPATTTPTTAPN